MHRLADNLWVLPFPLRLLGTEQGRVVTVIRLASGALVIHSTAPFTPGNVKAISAQGEPRWLVDAMLLHDTFAKQGAAAFPGLPLLAPEGFSEASGVPAQPLLPPPPEWAGELEVLALGGVPKLKEHVFFHRPSRTLIVADLVFNFNDAGNAWERFFRRWAIGLRHQPGMTRIFRFFIKDRAAFIASMREVFAWDFDRIICGHKEVVETGGKDKLRQALADAGVQLE